MSIPRRPLDRIIQPAAKLPLAEVRAEVEKAAQGLAVNEKILAKAAMPEVRGYLAAELDAAGATLGAAAKAIAEAHQADDIRVVNTESGPEVVRAGPDHSTRLKAAELNLKARGELRDGATANNLFIGLSDEQVAAIASGQVDPAKLIQLSPRQAIEAEALIPPPGAAKI